MRTSYFVVAALAAMGLSARSASADILGDEFALTFNYAVVSSSSHALVFGSPDKLDLPPEQEWMVNTEVGDPISIGELSLSFDLFYSDASDFEAAMDFSLLAGGLADGSGVPLEIVGDILLWFTPQMDAQTDPGMVLVEGLHWQQQEHLGNLRYRIGTGGGIETLVPAELAPSYFPDGNEVITDVHWTFDVRNVPEPTTLALFVVGALQTLRRRR